jgi:hypothetical protein
VVEEGAMDERACGRPSTHVDRGMAGHKPLHEEKAEEEEQRVWNDADDITDQSDDVPDPG